MIVDGLPYFTGLTSATNEPASLLNDEQGSYSTIVPFERATDGLEQLAVPNIDVPGLRAGEDVCARGSCVIRPLSANCSIPY